MIYININTYDIIYIIISYTYIFYKIETCIYNPNFFRMHFMLYNFDNIVYNQLIYF